MTKWIESKQAKLLQMAYDLELLEQYQLYLDKDPDSMVEWDEEDDIHGPMDFVMWLEIFQEEVDFQHSEEYANFIQRD